MFMTHASATEHRRDDERWRAVAARDRRANGQFVYAVGSTGIYCRPGCPSRRPNPDRVTFFDSPAEAARAGYRPCRRCRPDQPAAADPWLDKVRRACVYLANVEGPVSLARLAARLGGSPYHVQRSFKRIVGVTPREYADACRLRNVKTRLRASDRVTDAMLDAGYGSTSRFYERAVPRLGMTPATYRRGGAGVRIQYAIVDSPLGRLLVAATDRGVCAVAMAASDRELLAGLHEEYPRATLVQHASGLRRWTREIVRYLEGRTPRVDLPLDVRATAFQWQVWNALAAIPSGETRSYKDIARAIGRPTAARAVSRACATNPVALAIPCHRVVSESGRTGGYRWGVARKKELLAAEHKMKFT